MPLVPVSYESLYSRFRSQMESLGLTNWSQGSVIGMIGKVICAYLAELWSTLAALDEQSNPTTARGEYLDRFGTMFGVRRLGPQTASTLGKGPSVKFTNTGSTQVSIPSNTRVWNASDPSIAFFTTQAVTVAAGADADVNVVAARSGEVYNVGANTLNSHNSMGQLRVTNVRPIGGGTNGEDDESYRFRIQGALRARAGYTEDAIIQALLAVPGIREVYVNSGARGNGTVDVIITPIDRYMSEDVLIAAESEVDRNVTAGVSWRVRTPVSRRVDLRIQLRLKSGVTLAEVRGQVESSVRGYLDNRRVNDGKGESDLIYNELVSRVQDSSDKIVDSIVQIVVDGETLLQANFSPRPGERIISGSCVIS